MKERNQKLLLTPIWVLPEFFIRELSLFYFELFYRIPSENLASFLSLSVFNITIKYSKAVEEVLNAQELGLYHNEYSDPYIISDEFLSEEEEALFWDALMNIEQAIKESLEQEYWEDYPYEEKAKLLSTSFDMVAAQVVFSNDRVCSLFYRVESCSHGFNVGNAFFEFESDSFDSFLNRLSSEESHDLKLYTNQNFNGNIVKEDNCVVFSRNPFSPNKITLKGPTELIFDIIKRI